MKKNVLNFEPKLALFVEDEHPLFYYECILKKSKNYINKYGLIFFEINDILEKSLTQVISKKYNFKIQFFKDLFDKNRFLKIET